MFLWAGHRCFVDIGNTPACVRRAIKRHGVPAEIWSPWYGRQRDVAQSDKKGSAGETITTRNHSWNFVDTRLHAFPHHAEENQTVGVPSPSAMTRAQKVSPLSLALNGRPSFKHFCESVCGGCPRGDQRWHPSGCVSCDVFMHVVPDQPWSHDCSVGLVWVW